MCHSTVVPAAAQPVLQQPAKCCCILILLFWPRIDETFYPELIYADTASILQYSAYYDCDVLILTGKITTELPNICDIQQMFIQLPD